MGAPAGSAQLATDKPVWRLGSAVQPAFGLGAAEGVLRGLLPWMSISPTCPACFPSPPTACSSLIFSQAVVYRRLLAPELPNILSRCSTLLVTAQAPSVRLICGQV